MILMFFVKGEAGKIIFNEGLFEYEQCCDRWTSRVSKWLIYNAGKSRFPPRKKTPHGFTNSID